MNLIRKHLLGRFTKYFIVLMVFVPLASNLPISDVTISGPSTAFGEVLAAQVTPQVQVSFSYNLNERLVTSFVFGGAGTKQDSGMAVCSTGANANAKARVQSRRKLKYNPGQGAMLRATAVFTTGTANSTQLVGCGDSLDGFFFGFNGTSFGLLRRKGEVDTWTAQTSWNVDKMNGAGGSENRSTMNLIHTFGNVYQISYQWLGFGNIDFSIEDGETGSIILVHRIKYANTATSPSIFNPSFPVLVQVENTSNTTDIVIKTSSMSAFIEGKTPELGLQNSFSHVKLTVSAETVVMSIQNRRLHAGKLNRVPVIPTFISLANDGTKTVRYNVYGNVTLTGEVFEAINATTSVVDFDTTATSFTGGFKVLTFVLGKDENLLIPLKELELFIDNTDILTFTAESSNNTDVEIGFGWKEDF